MKDIDIQEIFENRHLQELEFEILDLDSMAEKELYSGSGCNSAKVAIRKLLLVRKRLLDSMFVMTDAYKRLLGEFNDALSAKLLDVRKKSVLMYESLNALNMGGSLSVHGKCFLGYEYSKLHPIQTRQAKKIWDIMNGCLDDYVSLYKDGVTHLVINTRYERIPTENEVLYLSDKLDNWNEGFDREMTKDMNLIYAVHNLTDHMEFSIFDLLWIRDFNVEITAEWDDD